MILSESAAPRYTAIGQPSSRAGSSDSFEAVGALHLGELDGGVNRHTQRIRVLMPGMRTTTHRWIRAEVHRGAGRLCNLVEPIQVLAWSWRSVGSCAASPAAHAVVLEKDVQTDRVPGGGSRVSAGG